MNDKLVILYHTNSSGNLSAGPTYSIPKQILAQSAYDDVFWINKGERFSEEWKETGLFHSADAYAFRSLEDLPAPYNKPDMVVFESFYNFSDVKLAKELVKKNIPYIIVPRGALTIGAQKLKWLKKAVANLLVFKGFAKHAAAIQFLTRPEAESSGNAWNKTSIIIPNGVSLPEEQKKTFSHDKIVFSFIGRLAIEHKGLDILLDSIEILQQELRDSNCVFHIYGSDHAGSVEDLKCRINEKHIDDLVTIYPGVFGAEKVSVLLDTDIFVLTSRFEGHPTGLLEALAYGLPCLVTTGSNMREEIERYGAGWTSDIAVSGVVEQLRVILREKEEIPKKGENAYKLVQEYNWHHIAKKTHQHFLSVVTKNRSTRK